MTTKKRGRGRPAKVPAYTFKQFAEECDDFDTSPHGGERDVVSIVYQTLQLNGESGELRESILASAAQLGAARVAEHVKKAMRDDKLGREDRRLEPERREKILLEVFDVLYSLTRLMHELASTPEEVAALGFAKCEQRIAERCERGDPIAMKVRRKRQARKSA